MIVNIAPMTLRPLVEELRDRLTVVRRGGSEAARAKHTGRGKLLARDRVDRLLDPGSPFGRVCQPEDVANAVRFLVSSRASYITGEKLCVYGGPA